LRREPTSKVRHTKLPYKVGDWFVAPLRGNRRYAVGRIARVAPRGKIILCYFFGPPVSRVPKAAELEGRSPKDAVLVARCGDLALINGEWIIVGSSSLMLDEWGMPKFRRTESISGTNFIVMYAENDPSREVDERKVSPTFVAGLPANDLFGCGAVEIRLSKLLGPRNGHSSKEADD
jgi:immunity protein 26 of polymorphic toxin system